MAPPGGWQPGARPGDTGDGETSRDDQVWPNEVVSKAATCLVFCVVKVPL